MQIDEIDAELSSGTESDDEENYAHTMVQHKRFYLDVDKQQSSSRSFKYNSMWYITIETLGTALKIFTPAAILSWLYRHDSFIFKILHHCDKTIRAVIYRENPDEPDQVLKWLQEIFPQDDRVKSLDEIWANGSVVCEIVQSVIPGSCSGHHESNDLIHGQRLAEQYLGIKPVFTTDDLTQPSLTTYNECKLSHFLNSIKDALSQLSPPISRTGSPILNVQAYTLDYVARGMGLVTATQNKKAIFYIYPTAQQGIEPGDISIQIKGPEACYGSTLVPAIYGKTHVIRNVFQNIGQGQYCLPYSLVRSNNTERNYFLPKIANDIDVNATINSDKVKVIYIPTTQGYHELTLISKGCHLIGSPFTINVEEGSNVMSQSFEEDSPIKESKMCDKKIVFRIVDFVTEKMLLKEDGTLEKISDEEAKALIHKVESIENIAFSDQFSIDLIDTDEKNKNNSFNVCVKKILLLLYVCRELKSMVLSKKKICENFDSKENISTPDIVNSTLKERCLEESSSISQSAKELRKQYKNKLSSFNRTTDKGDLLKKDKQSEDENNSDDILETEVNVCSRIPSIDIIISSFEEDEDMNNFTPAIIPIERPKTPVIKILSGHEIDTVEKFHGIDIKKYNGNFDSLTQEEYNNDLISYHNDNINIDEEDESESIKNIQFRIGEPVTLTHQISATNTDVDMDSIILSSNLEEALQKFDIKLQKNMKDLDSRSGDSSLFTTPLRQTPFDQMTDSEIIQMYEEPPIDEPLENIDYNIIQNKNIDINVKNEEYITRTTSIDTWDSAYMSVDEITSSPEANRIISIDEFSDDIDYSKMGPAERELWGFVNENDYNSNNTNVRKRLNKSHVITISPIIENDMNENDDVFINVSNNHDDSASGQLTDVNLSSKQNVKETISSIQNNAELKDDNHNEQIENSFEIINVKCNNEIMTTKKNNHLSKSISEKKEYWDEKISNILNAEEKAFKNVSKSFDRSNTMQKNEQLKCINQFKEEEMQDFIDLNEKLVSEESFKIMSNSYDRSNSIQKNEQFNFSQKCVNQYKEEMHDSIDLNEKLVSKWKKYWDEKIESSPSPESNTKCIQNHVLRNRKYLVSPDEESVDENDIDLYEFNENYNNSLKVTKKINNKEHYKIIKNLSDRIDKYLDTITTPSPNIDLEVTFSTPDLPIKIDIPNKINNISTINNDETNEESNYDCVSVKKLRQLFDSNTTAKEHFQKNKSKTFDLPKLSIKSLKKYFSMESLPSMNDTNINRIYRTKSTQVIESKILNKQKSMNNNINKSIESFPTMSEKKAVIELHLKSIQNKLINNNLINHLNNVQTKICNNMPANNQTDIEEISKPIGSIVAQFENCRSPLKNKCYLETRNVLKLKSNKLSERPAVSDAVSPVGTIANDEVDKSIIVSEIDSEDMISKKLVLTKDDDDFIQSQNYKERFKQTKLFFQNLDVRQKNISNNKTKTLNECEKILLGLSPQKTKIYNKANKSCNNINLCHNIINEKAEMKVTSNNYDNKKPNKVYRKTKHKAFSAPTSDNELEYQRNAKLIKISEKFLVKDLFKDVTGESNRRGFYTFKGIPHKNAVLAAFKSMEDIDQLNSYEYSTMNEINENNIYEHNEKKQIENKTFEYDSSGLILRKDFLKLQKSRRNSAPELHYGVKLNCSSQHY